MKTTDVLNICGQKVNSDGYGRWHFKHKAFIIDVYFGKEKIAIHFGWYGNDGNPNEIDFKTLEIDSAIINVEKEIARMICKFMKTLSPLHSWATNTLGDNK